jgi:hypothetical protein
MSRHRRRRRPDRVEDAQRHRGGVRHPAPQGTVPIAPKAVACGWSPGALSGSREDRTVPHLLTANSNGRKPMGAWVLAGVVEVVFGHWCTYGVIQGGDPSTVIQCVAFRLAMALTVLMQQPTRLRESAAPGGRGSTGNGIGKLARSSGERAKRNIQYRRYRVRYA